MDDKKTFVPRLKIVTGDDNFAMDLTYDKYLRHIKAERGEIVIETFDSANERIGEFLARAMTGALFQEVRLFCILHAQDLKEDDLKALNEMLDYEISDVYMFISAEFDKSTETGKKKMTPAAFAKSLRAKERTGNGSASVEECPRPKDYKIAEWIVTQVPLFFNRQISKPDAEYLAEIVDYNLLYSELQKIDMALEPGARIDKETIKKISGETRTMTVYELADALGKKNLPTALKVIDSLFTGTFYAPLALSTVFKHFWSMLKIKKYLEANPQTLRNFNSRDYNTQNTAAFEIGSAAGLLTEKTKTRVYPMIIKSGIVQQSQSYSEKALREILKTLQRFDVDIKTGRVEPVPYNLQMLCYQIVRAA